jgi:outer membrane protein
MKNLLRKTIPVLLLLLLSAAPVLAQGRIATIDLRKVFDSYWKTKEADASLKDRAADMDKQYKDLTDDWKKARDEYQKLQTAASDQAVAADEREKRKKTAELKLLEIRESEQTIDSFRRQAAATLDEQKRRMRDKILGEIRTAVNAKAKAASYSMVIDVAAESANATPVLLYNTGDNDITDDILSQLNATAPATSPKSSIDRKEKDADKKGEK